MSSSCTRTKCSWASAATIPTAALKARASASRNKCARTSSPRVWRYRDVKDGWDDLVLTSWVQSPETGLEVVYQQGPLGAILSADDLLARVRPRIKDEQCEGLVIFSGTLPLVAGKIVYTPEFRCELLNPHTGHP